MGIDGFRIDTMKHVNDEFWQKFGPEVLAYAKSQGKREFFMFGEVFDTSRPFTSQYTTQEQDAGRPGLPVPGRRPQLRLQEPADRTSCGRSSATTTGTPTRIPTSTSCRPSSVITTWAGSATSSTRTTRRAPRANWWPRPARPRADVLLPRQSGDLLRRRAGVHRHRRRPGGPADHVRQPGRRLPRRRPARHGRRTHARGQLRPQPSAVQEDPATGVADQGTPGAAQRCPPGSLRQRPGRHLRLLAAAPEPPAGVRGGVEQQRVGEDCGHPHLRQERILPAGVRDRGAVT